MGCLGAKMPLKGAKILHGRHQIIEIVECERVLRLFVET
jgi:hypothetical protein